MFEQVRDFQDECDALHALLEPLAERDFGRTTQFKGYTIGDVVGHLHHWNVAADLSLRDEAGFREDHVLGALVDRVGLPPDERELFELIERLLDGLLGEPHAFGEQRLRDARQRELRQQVRAGAERRGVALDERVAERGAPGVMRIADERAEPGFGLTVKHID